jgi:hypothetical protein
MPGLLGELFQVLQLGPPVPLPKGVDVVNVADDDGGLLGEGRSGVRSCLSRKSGSDVPRRFRSTDVPG